MNAVVPLAVQVDISCCDPQAFSLGAEGLQFPQTQFEEICRLLLVSSKFIDIGHWQCILCLTPYRPRPCYANSGSQR